jgi:hypothetical protein
MSHEQTIALMAYYKWNDAGRPDNEAERFWLVAEEEFYKVILPQYGDGPYQFLGE